MENRILACEKAFLDALRPPSKLSLSEWADQYAYLSAESSSEAGRWRTLPYQKGIMDAITDPSLYRVSVKKSARVGYTKILNHALGYFIHQDPCSIMLVQPTVEDAEGYSKEEIAPMLRDTPVLRGLVSDAKQKDGTNSILHKLFPGGQLSLVGANSPRGFRRVSRRVVAFDETSAFPMSAGAEGSPIKLGIKRTDYFWNRKIIDGSTPGVDGVCAITQAFEEGDQRRRFLPCPQCGHMQYLKFENLKWPENEPMKAFFVCEAEGCVIEHSSLRSMDERGEWRATATSQTPGHASFHIWAAYSYSPNSTWGHIAAEFVQCKKNVEDLKTFVMTVLGETWVEKGEAPDHMRLYERREHYKINSVPKNVAFLSSGTDIQKDRIELEIVGWTREKRSYSIDYRVIMGDTATEAPWKELDKVLNETWVSEDGRQLTIKMLCVDSGYNTQHVYDWVRKHPSNRVRAIKGYENLQMTFGQPRAADLNHKGERTRRGLLYFPVGSSHIKTELYSWLKLDGPGDGEDYSPGYCHFPQYDEEYFKRLASEHLIKKTIAGRTVLQWAKKYERNEALDCRVYARAAAAMFGMDRFNDVEWDYLEGKFEEPDPEPTPTKQVSKPVREERPAPSQFWGNNKKKFW